MKWFIRLMMVITTAMILTGLNILRVPIEAYMSVSQLNGGDGTYVAMQAITACIQIAILLAWSLAIGAVGWTLNDLWKWMRKKEKVDE